MKEQIVEVKISLETTNAAFAEGNLEREVSRILTEAAEKMCNGPNNQNLLDINGNKVGYVLFVSQMIPDRLTDATESEI